MREEKLSRIMAAALMVTAASVSGYHRHKAERASQEKSSASCLKEEGLPTAIALRSSGLVPVLSVAAYILNPRWMKWSSLEVPPWLRWSGAGLGTASLPLSWWVFRTIGENITPSVTTRKDHELVTGGPYRWVRHPLYSVGTAFFASLSVLAANWFMGLASLSVLVMLIVRLPKEEEKLIERLRGIQGVHEADRAAVAAFWARFRVGGRRSRRLAKLRWRGQRSPILSNDSEPRHCRAG